LDDLIVSGYQADPSGKSSAGKSYVIFGKTDTGAIDLANLRLSLILVRSRVKSEPSNTRVSIPPPPSTRARLPAPDPSGKSSAGKSYVIFGKTDTDAIDLTNLSGDSKYS
jgi:hypothetical protein